MIPPLKHTQRLRLIRDVFVLRLAAGWVLPGGLLMLKCGGFMGSESRQKTKLIQVRATPGEKDELKARAAAFGVSMGELCRRVIFSSKPKSKVDQSAIAELAATRADLGRLGGLLKGWLSGVFPQGAPVPQSHAEVVALLRKVEAAQKDVLNAVKKLMEKA